MAYGKRKRSRKSNKGKRRSKKVRQMSSIKRPIFKKPFTTGRLNTQLTIKQRVQYNTAASGGFERAYWYLNDVYNAYGGTGGIQPIWYDQLLNGVGPYTRFYVRKTHVKALIVNEKTTDVVKAYGSISPEAVTYDSILKVLEKPCITKVVKPMSSNQLTMNSSTVGHLGRLTYNDDLAGTYNASPPIRGPVFTLWLHDETGDDLNCTVTIYLTFDVTLYGRRTPQDT